ncbi:ATP-binding protein, partial [Amaricoccus sp. HAR-UPW-R2A-40]
MLNGTRFDSIQEQDILQLIDNGVREGLLLEYKRDRYGQSDADKKEFLKDISSFANRSGGHLIIGINEQDGIAASISAIPEDQIDQEL